jgi:hypothetical protein
MTLPGRRNFRLTSVDQQARKTTLIVAGVMTLLAAFNAYRGRLTTAIVMFGCGGALLIAGLLVPIAARRFHTLWMGLAGVFGYVNTRVLLSVVFFLVVTPYGIASRVFGRNILRRRGPASDTYWIPRQKGRQAKEQFERLF